MPEYDAFDEDPSRGDHAAKWETSILAHLRPELVDMSRLSDGRDDPLYGIYGDDPRETARSLIPLVLDVVAPESGEWLASTAADHVDTHDSWHRRKPVAAGRVPGMRAATATAANATPTSGAHASG